MAPHFPTTGARLWTGRAADCKRQGETKKDRWASIPNIQFLDERGARIHPYRCRGRNDEYIRGLGQPWAEADIKEESKEQLRRFGESICRGLPCIYHDAIVGDDVVHGISEAVDRCKATLLILPVVHPGKRFLPSRGERIGRAVKVPVFFLKDVTLASAPGRDAGEGLRNQLGAAGWIKGAGACRIKSFTLRVVGPGDSPRYACP